ncbi:proton-conducting transporter transmembrane domain-containing protein [Geoalkalibacter sp.]|uniref:proton-conducting transporter transmembrane domain-containing protein n=1 Tax=Geoalkalibacter sp. TaxID=3041440 RepID=UPI00272EE784|nr:proton-conducting transporter membrane subunit [Geoalkalibacter sp.]
MLVALILLPLLPAALSLVLPWYQLRSWLLSATGAAHLGLALLLVSEAPPLTNPWIGLDALSCLVLLVTSLLYLGCAFYAVDYLAMRRDRGNRVMVPCLLVFLSAMTLAISARHLGLLWVAVETTTLVSAPLIYYNRNRLSIEATWKYLLLCSVGIALAMLGMMFVGYAALGGGEPPSLHFDWLLEHAPSLSRPWLHAGFVFLLVGFGTKMGLAPLHSWKPDAYGEAPALVGALLSGGLTSVSFLAILRAVQLMAAAGDQLMARQALVGLGLLSLLLAAVFMVRQPDIKRMLAYSSVEHMGILALGVGIGGLATFGALLHLINNALTKGCLFLTAGNIQRAFASKHLSEVRGALSVLPLSGGLFLAGFLAITGAPPFGPFLSEFTILRGLFAAERPLIAGAFLLLLAVIFIGMGATVLGATQGAATEPPGRFKDRLLLVAPPLVMLLLVLSLGLYLPEPLHRLLEAGAHLLEVRS